MFKVLSEKPSSFPISTSYMMSYLRAPDEDESLVKKIIARAFAAFADYTNGCHAAPATFDIIYDASEVITRYATELPVRPLRSVISTLEAQNENGDSTELVPFSVVGDKRFVITENIPSDAVTVKVVAEVGFTEDTIPDSVLAGIEQMVVHLYSCRGDCGDGGAIPDSVALLWAPYVRYYL